MNYAPVAQLEDGMGLKSLSVAGSNPPGSTKCGVSTTVSALACQTRDVSSILIHRSEKFVLWTKTLRQDF